MWKACTVPLAVAVLVIFACMAEAKPKSDIDLPLGDTEFLQLLIGKGVEGKMIVESCDCPGLGGGCRCVSFQVCEDPQENEVVQDYTCDADDSDFFINPDDERTGQPVISANSSTSPCGDPLQLCCKCVKDTSGTIKPKIPTTPTPTQSQCGRRNPNGVGITINDFTDSQTQVGEFPWMVAVLGQENAYVAGGSLVHPKVILTAGHKVHGKNAADLVARIGDWDIAEARENPVPQNIGVDRIVYHPDFVRNKHENNVALLILKKEAEFNKLVMPICLPQHSQNFDRANCFVTGWGKDVFGNQGQYQQIMKKIPMPMVPSNECQTMLRNTRLGSKFTLHDSFVCAGGLGEDACTGDGGSPLVCPNPSNPDEYIQVGVVSWGIGCKTIGNPGVYGSISHTVDWIAKAIADETGGIDERLAFDERIG